MLKAVDIGSWIKNRSETNSFTTFHLDEGFFQLIRSPFEVGLAAVFIRPAGNVIVVKILGAVYAAQGGYSFWGYAKTSELGFICGWYDPQEKAGWYSQADILQIGTTSERQRSFESNLTVEAMIKSAEGAFDETNPVSICVDGEEVAVQLLGLGHVTVNGFHQTADKDVWFIGYVVNGDDEGVIEGCVSVLTGKGHYFYR